MTFTEPTAILAAITALGSFGAMAFGGSANLRMGKVLGMASTWLEVVKTLRQQSGVQRDQGVALLRLDEDQKRTRIDLQEHRTETRCQHKDLSDKLDGVRNQILQLRWSGGD